LGRKIVKTNNETDGFNKRARAVVLFLIKYTDTIISYDGRSLYNQYDDQQTQANRILTTLLFGAAE